MYTDFTSAKIIPSLADPGQWDLKNSHGKVSGDSASKLWHLVRALDLGGSGSALLSLKYCANFFNVQERALQRWLKSGIDLGFFRSYRYLANGQVQIYYRSALRLACRLKVHDLGAIVTAPIEALKNLKQSSAIATALELQRRSRYRAERKKGLGEKIDIAKLFGSTFAHGTRAIARTVRYIYLTEESNIYGGSQRRAAWEQGRHECTTYRRLKALSPLNKRQIAQAKPEYLKEFFYKTHCELDTGRLFRIPDYPQLIFKAGCCLYYFPDWELGRHKCLRSKVKKALQFMKNSLD
jgi:hypothetical protein